MAVTVTHATVTAVPDDPAYDIGSDEWNAAHTVTGLGTAATAATTDFATAAQGATADSAVQRAGDTMTGALVVGNGTLTASTPAIDISQTWNDASVAFTGFKVGITGIGSGRIDSTIAEFVRSDGYGVRVVYYGLGISVGDNFSLNANSAIGTGFRNDAGLAFYGDNGGNDSNRSAYCRAGTGFTFNSSWPVIFGDVTTCTGDIGLSRNAAGVLEVNNATNGTFRDLLARNVVTSPTTVAGLTAAQKGARSFVTDATATTFASIVAGGGANNVPVYYDGTNWLIG